MPLNDTLNAIRGLVLDYDHIPEDRAQRSALIKEIAPGLTDDELEDLLKMSVDMLSIYHRTIFSGEAKVLKNHFKITLAYLEQNLPEYSLFNLTTTLHKQYPWKSNLTLELAENFKQYVQSLDLSTQDLLSEIVDLEYTSLQVKKDKTSQENLISKPIDLQTLKIEELLDLNYQVNPTLQFKSYQYNLVKIYRYFYSNNQQLPVDYEQCKCHAISSRTEDGRALWAEVPIDIFNFLQQETSFKIASLAEVFILTLDRDLDEQEKFQNFFNFLKELIKVNALVYQSN